jgi:hypothetical protein
MATEERETAGLISSDKVEGTNVYGATGEKIGSIERVMIDKRRSVHAPRDTHGTDSDACLQATAHV